MQKNDQYRVVMTIQYIFVGTQFALPIYAVVDACMCPRNYGMRECEST